MAENTTGLRSLYRRLASLARPTNGRRAGIASQTPEVVECSGGETASECLGECSNLNSNTNSNLNSTLNSNTNSNLNSNSNSYLNSNANSNMNSNSNCPSNCVRVAEDASNNESRTRRSRRPRRHRSHVRLPPLIPPPHSHLHLHRHHHVHSSSAHYPFFFGADSSWSLNHGGRLISSLGGVGGGRHEKVCLFN